MTLNDGAAVWFAGHIVPVEARIGARGDALFGVGWARKRLMHRCKRRRKAKLLR
jgi:hypothetical protein